MTRIKPAPPTFEQLVAAAKLTAPRPRHDPVPWPSEAFPPVPGRYDGTSLIAVQDNHLTVHAARVGPGILCPAIRRASSSRYTLTWSYDLARIDCLDCMIKLSPADRELVFRAQDRAA